MDFDLSPPQQMLRDSARAMMARRCPIAKVRELAETDTAIDDDLWNEIAGQGWLGIALAERDGGLGLGLVDLAVVAEQMGRACLPGPFLSTLWAAHVIAESSHAETTNRYLNSILTGDARATVALLEPGSTWDPASVRLSATKAGEGYSLSGQKRFVPDAAAARVLLVVARHGSDLVLLAVPTSAPELRIAPVRTLDPTRKLYTVEFDGVRVSGAIAVGDRASGAFERATAVATLAVCAELVGVMQWMLDTTVEYAKTRVQFEKVIGSFQAVQHKCVDILTLLENARSATYYAAWALSAGDPAAAKAITTAKAFCSDAGREAGNLGIQVHGGIGYTWEHDLHLYYKRAKFSEIMFGDATWHRERLAELILDGSFLSKEQRHGGSDQCS